MAAEVRDVPARSVVDELSAPELSENDAWQASACRFECQRGNSTRVLKLTKAVIRPLGRDDEERILSDDSFVPRSWLDNSAMPQDVNQSSLTTHQAQLEGPQPTSPSPDSPSSRLGVGRRAPRAGTILWRAHRGSALYR